MKGNWKSKGRISAKPLTTILVEICHSGLPQANLGQEDLSENEGGRSGEREVEREMAMLMRVEERVGSGTPQIQEGMYSS